MYKQIKRKKLGRKKSHRESLIRNLLRGLFDNNTVVTTTPKAKVLKQEASSLIGKGLSKGDKNLEFRREVIRVLGKDELVKKYYEYIKKEKVGVGFVRVGFRDGDNAEMARVSLLGLEKPKKEVKAKKSVKKESPVEEKEVEKKEVKENKFVKGDDKRVDKTAVIKKTTRAKSRSGI
jgi:large subunit ribosomal protein L17